MNSRRHSVDPWNEQVHGPYEVHQAVSSVDSQEDKVKSMGNTFRVDPSDMLVVHQNLKPNSGGPAVQSHVESHSDSSKVNGTLKVLPRGQASVDNAGLTQFSSPSSISFSPSRYITSPKRKKS